jgi:hypothetical protein
MDLEAKPSQEQQARDLTGFGTCVYTLMFSRGYKTVTRLAADMKQDDSGGFKITKQAVSNYTTGRRNVPATFVVRLTEVLDLDEQEKARLAWAFAYGQG